MRYVLIENRAEKENRLCIVHYFMCLTWSSRTDSVSLRSRSNATAASNGKTKVTVASLNQVPLREINTGLNKVGTLRFSFAVSF